jgi:hypothetical protein
MALTPPMLKNKLFKLLTLDTVKRPVFRSSVAPVSCWYVWSASVASKIRVVPTILLHLECYEAHNEWNHRPVSTIPAVELRTV